MTRAAIVVLLVATSCTSGTDLTVFAASSLTQPFTALAKTFEAAHRGTHVTFNFAASSALALQIEQGASPDVFASADDATMNRVRRFVGSRAVFARNRLEIVVAKGDPKHIKALADLSRPGLVVALCAHQVPCGSLADEALSKAHANVRAASREENVKAVLTKVELGEADAGIVYASDVRTAHDVSEVTIPASENVTTSYPIAVLRSASHAAAARSFVAFVRSAGGSRVLRRAGFLLPAA